MYDHATKKASTELTYICSSSSLAASIEIIRVSWPHVQIIMVEVSMFGPVVCYYYRSFGHQHCGLQVALFVLVALSAEEH
jgi:hypothetical protein